MKAKERVNSGTVLHRLPNELLGMIATQTDNKGLASMRATCRELRDGSAFEFFKRHTIVEYLSLDGDGCVNILSLTLEMELPDLAMA